MQKDLEITYHGELLTITRVAHYTDYPVVEQGCSYDFELIENLHLLEMDFFTYENYAHDNHIIIAWNNNNI